MIDDEQEHEIDEEEIENQISILKTKVCACCFCGGGRE
jgi:hypothetical protein